MGFREVSVVGVREILRLWLLGYGQRTVARLAQVDRKTVSRYVAAAEAAGLKHGDPEDRLTDELIGEVVETVRPGRPPGDHGSSWEQLLEHKGFIEERVKKKLTLVKVHDQLCRHTKRTIPYSTFHRFCVGEFGPSRGRSTVRIADCEPGEELQIDFGRMGLLFDLPPPAGPRIDLHRGLSRHTFVWLTFSQTLEAVISGCEAAWAFYGGIFRVVIPDNLKAIVVSADPVAPRLNDAFVEYAQVRCFVMDPARVRHAKDKARVERMVPFVRESFFRGEDFLGLADAQRRAETWCSGRAGMRIHGTTQRRPAEVFQSEELPKLAPEPESDYDLPAVVRAQGPQGPHIEVLKALYSVPGDLIGRYVRARADSQLVKVFYQGKVVKVHPRKQPSQRSTDPSDLPAEKTVYALRDINRLKQIACSHGPSVGVRNPSAAHRAAVDQDAHGLPAPGAGAALLGRARRPSLRQGARARCHRRQPHPSHARAGPGVPACRRTEPPAQVIPLRIARPQEEFRPGNEEAP